MATAKTDPLIAGSDTLKRNTLDTYTPISVPPSRVDDPEGAYTHLKNKKGIAEGKCSVEASCTAFTRTILPLKMFARAVASQLLRLIVKEGGRSRANISNEQDS